MDTKRCAGGIVVSPKSGILVVENLHHMFTFPKGGIKESETRESAALREIKEEGGLKTVQIIKYLGVLSREGFTAADARTPTVLKDIHMFHCTTQQLELGPFAPDIVGALWVPPEDLSGVLSWPQEVAFFDEHRHKLNL